MTNDRIWILLTRKLSGEATQTELEELDRLLSHCPDTSEQAQLVEGSWNEAPVTDGDFLEATYLLHLERMKAKGVEICPQGIDHPAAEEAVPAKKSYRRKLLYSLALVTSLATIWLIFLREASPTASPAPKLAKVVATPNGSRTKMTLPDGSSVWLNSGSKLTYNGDFETGTQREVKLSGEAFFDVVKNTSRPFIIHTEKMDVKVLGTRFNVKAYAGDKTTETSLIRGKVEVFLHSLPGKKYVLNPSQKLILLNDETEVAGTESAKNLSTNAADAIVIKALTYLDGTNTDVETSWTRNILSFEDESFSDVARKIERWYDVKVQFNNERWQQQFLRGSFKDETLEQAMTALQYSTGFEYKKEGTTIYIY